MTTHHAQFVLQCSTPKEASILFSTLSPELKQGVPKTKIHLEQQGNQLILSIDAKETTSLRAACNSYLRWVHTAAQVRQLL